MSVFEKRFTQNVVLFAQQIFTAVFLNVTFFLFDTVAGHELNYRFLRKTTMARKRSHFFNFFDSDR